MSETGRGPAIGRPYVAVCGPDPASPDQAAQAEVVGRLLAEAGAVVVCGGHGGVMEAVARGASAVPDGIVLGILPGPDRREGNRYLSLAVATGMGELRNGLIVRAADVVIAVGGEFGTLSEVALALKTGVPVVGLGTWELAKAGRPVEPDPIVRAATPEDAVREAIRLAASHAG
jgi:uncharacterized protein (TIGR00725 family)